MTDFYISADIEADGPIPGQYSMLSFGLCVAGRYDGRTFESRDPEADTFYRELKPAFDEVNQEALAVSRLDRDKLFLDGVDPTQAMEEAADWITQRAGSDRPVLVGFPLVFDWMFLHWYFVHYCGNSPFGFSSGLDMKSMYQAKAAVTIDRAGRADLPVDLTSSRPHTHNGLDDAIEQAHIFNRLFVWRGTACD
jgi:hypothetical protein